MMRSWGNRPDTAVVDEPLYAYYLDRTGLDHPGRDEVIASQPTDWRVVLAELASGPLPGGAVICYQKHMTHHLLPEVDRAALAPFRHAFLIRDPREVLASYARVRGRAHPGRPRAAAAGRDLRDVRRPGGRLPRPARRARGRPCARCASARRRRSTTRCSPGRPARGTATGSGRRTGTPAFGPRPASRPTAPPAEPLPARLEPPRGACLPYYDELAPLPASRPAGGPDAADLRRAQPRPGRQHQRQARATATRPGSARSTRPCRAATRSGRGCGSTTAGSSGWTSTSTGCALGPGAGVRADPLRRGDHRARSAARSPPTGCATACTSGSR